jgi:hypothetical protein
MAVQTQRALARRAIEAAELMGKFTKWAHEQAIDQKIDLSHPMGATATLNAGVLGNYARAMGRLSSDIRKLEGNLTRENVRACGHP